MSEYTTEEYREVLKAIYDMDSVERETAFGSDGTVYEYLKNFSATELIEKYRAYYNTPKTGEYWKNNRDGRIIVVLRVEENMVYVYYRDGSTNGITLKYFVGNFTKTEHKSKYLESFLSEMKEVSK